MLSSINHLFEKRKAQQKQGDWENEKTGKCQHLADLYPVGIHSSSSQTNKPYEHNSHVHCFTLSNVVFHCALPLHMGMMIGFLALSQETRALNLFVSCLAMLSARLFECSTWITLLRNTSCHVIRHGLRLTVIITDSFCWISAGYVIRRWCGIRHICAFPTGSHSSC